MTSSFLTKSLDESSNFLWISRNNSISRRPSFFMKRKQSLDSFSTQIRFSVDIELTFRNKGDIREFEEKKIHNSQNNYDNFIDEVEIMRSPSALLDINDNIYRKGKVKNI